MQPKYIEGIQSGMPSLGKGRVDESVKSIEDAKEKNCFCCGKGAMRRQ